MATFGDFFLTLVEHGLEAFGVYYGTYRAKVILNQDPEGLGRIMVHCPQVTGDTYPEVWAWPMAAFGGKGNGLWAIPDVNSWVYVKFDHGRPHYPLWTGGWWGTGEPNSEMEPSKVVLAVQEGMQVIIDRTARTIRLQSGEGNHVMLSDGQLELSHNLKVLVTAPQLDAVISGDATVVATGAASIQAMGPASLLSMAGSVLVDGADSVTVEASNTVSISGVGAVNVTSDGVMNLTAQAFHFTAAGDFSMTVGSWSVQASTVSFNSAGAFSSVASAYTFD